MCSLNAEITAFLRKLKPITDSQEIIICDETLELLIDTVSVIENLVDRAKIQNVPVANGSVQEKFGT